MNSLLKLFLNDVSGASAIEYVLIAFILALGIVLGVASLRDDVQSSFEDTSGKLDAVVIK